MGTSENDADVDKAGAGGKNVDAGAEGGGNATAEGTGGGAKATAAFTGVLGGIGGGECVGGGRNCKGATPGIDIETNSGAFAGDGGVIVPTFSDDIKVCEGSMVLLGTGTRRGIADG